MKRMGICQKCGQYKMVHDHHYKGYDSDEVAPYCQGCDLKAHHKAKKEGKCEIDPELYKQKQLDGRNRLRRLNEIERRKTHKVKITINIDPKYDKMLGILKIEKGFMTKAEVVVKIIEYFFDNNMTLD